MRAFGTDGRIGAVARRDQRLIRQREQFVVDGFQNVFERAAPQVSSPDAALKKCVARN